MAIKLFSDKEDCCGCGACMNICPKSAITMRPDEAGFLYPAIDDKLCIECKACQKVCNYQNGHELNEPKKAFAAVNSNKKQLMLSASGGVFSAIATKILKEGGVVFGATLSFDNGYANPHHIGIESINELPKLQGSKYVQSKIGDTYKQAKRYLSAGRTVLFSGTPCQIDGLYGYLKKDFDNLFTIDVICHGVPNEKFFNDYLEEERKRRKARKITGYTFRDKSQGWGMVGRIDLLKKDGSSDSVYIPARLESYYTLFLDAAIYRENCYSCKYAAQKRIADLTIGDFWGIETEHPELLVDNSCSIRDGISCVLANSNKGISICRNMKEILQFHDSSFEKISHKNGQLIEPSHKMNSRSAIMQIYTEKGYVAVESWFRKKYKKQIVMHTLYHRLPIKLRLRIKQVLKG